MRGTFFCFAAIGLCACGSGGSGGTIQLPNGWTALKAMPSGLGEVTAATLDGKIYVAGGYNTRPTFQIYDIASDSWELGPNMPAGTDNAGAVAVSGKVYVFGGEASTSTQIHDVAARSWRLGPALPEVRFSSVVAEIGGKVQLVGGWSWDRANNVSIDSHDSFDLSTQAFESPRRAPLPTPRNHAAAAVIEGKLYVTGGRGPGHEAEDAHNIPVTEVYDPVADAWTRLADLPTPRSGGASAVLGGKLYVLGGGLPGNAVYATIERYDPVTAKWERLEDMPAPATGMGAVAAGGSLYIFGGFRVQNGQRLGTSGTNAAFRYTPPQ